MERAPIASELEQLQNLTPGDIAVVKRQVEFFEKALTLAKILDSLKLECRSKPGQQSGRIGFLR